MTTITLAPIVHRNTKQIRIAFKYDAAIKEYVKKFQGVKWSQTKKTFYVNYSPSVLRELFTYLNQKNYYVDYSALKKTANLKDRTISKIHKYNSKEIYRKLPQRLKTMLKGYTSYLRGKRLSKSTVSTYGHFVLRYLDHAQKIEPELWNKRTIELFMENVIAKENYSISSHRQCISAIKHFTVFCNLEGFDATSFERPKKSKFLPVVLSKEEVIDLIQTTKNLKHRAIIGLLYSGGLRIGELLNIKLKDIDIDRSQIHVKNSKGRKDRTVIMSEVIKPLLLNYINTYKPSFYFIEGQTGNKYSASSVRSFIKKASKVAGIGKFVTPHTLRHSYATHMLENGVDIRYIQELLGHSKPETTMIYTHVAKKDLMQIRNPLDVTVESLAKNQKDEQKVLLSRNIRR